MERTPEQIAKTEALFRNVNEEIRDASGRFDAETGAFVCECSDPTCTDHVQMPLDDYEDVRRHPTRFIVRPGHVKGPVEQIVERHRRYMVVEKVDRLVGAIARRLNPRADAV
jgi:hypothetical protein